MARPPLPWKNFRVKACTLFSLLLLLTPLASNAQSALAQTDPQQAIEDAYQGKVLLLRGRYRGAKLSFDPKGGLEGTATAGPISLSAIMIEKIDFHPDHLDFKGHRAVLVRTSPDGAPLLLKAFDLPASTDIRIGRDKGNPDQLNEALRTVFAQSLPEEFTGMPDKALQDAIESLPSDVPLPDQPPVTSAPPPSGTDPGIVAPTKDVTAPTLLYSVTPSYSKQAKSHHLEGICELTLTVGPDGLPTNIRVARPLPDGLDDEAILAVSQYRFAPAVYQNHPVAVKLKVEVSFHLF